MLSFQHLYDAYEANHRIPPPQRALSAMEQFTKRRLTCKSMSAFDRIKECRRGLEALDRQGWNRSYHQRQFHEQFIRACARIFYKTEAPGVFQRDHQKLLQVNGWQNLSQEILISTPRRFGKTISVSLFAAAILFSAPCVELSIYSTCKRISQKLLRNVKRFLELIYVELEIQPYKVIRRCAHQLQLSPHLQTNNAHTHSNCEELVINGPGKGQDYRVVNSYPSRVRSLKTFNYTDITQPQQSWQTHVLFLLLIQDTFGEPPYHQSKDATPLTPHP